MFLVRICVFVMLVLGICCISPTWAGNGHPGTDSASLKQHIEARWTGVHKPKPGSERMLNMPAGSKRNFDSLYRIKPMKHNLPESCGIGNNIVYGFHPGWMGSAWKSYNFNLLSHVAYFAYVIDVNTGKPKDLYDWKTTEMVETAQQAGCRVDLTITTNGSGGRSYTLLNNATTVDSCIANVMKMIQLRKADGVNVDFEDLRSEDKVAFTNFITKLRTALRNYKADATVSIACTPSGATSQFDIPNLMPVTDYFVIMGYDYTYSGSSTSGAVAPLPSSYWSYMNTEKSIDQYLDAGASKEKTLLAVPYYGYEWVTTSESVSTGNVVNYVQSVIYRDLQEEVIGYYKQQWQSSSGNYYYTKPTNGQYNQVWADDSISLSQKYDMVKQKGIAGIGIWALGYDNGYLSLWDLLHEEFGECTHLKSTGSTGIQGLQAAVSGTANVPFDQTAWHIKHRWILLYGSILGFMLLVLLVSFSRKFREEVFNRYTFYIMPVVGLLVILLIVHEFLNEKLFQLSDWFPWYAAGGLAVGLLAFIMGKKWRAHREHSE